MPPAARQSTGSEAGSRAGWPLTGRSQLIEPALGLVKKSRASSSQRQSPLERADRFVELRLMLAHPQDQRSGEVGDLGVGARFRDMVLQRSLHIAAIALELKENLEGKLSGQMALAH